VKRSIIIVLTIALLGSGAWYWENNRYVEYVPTIRGSDMNHSLKELSDLNNNDKHRNAIIQILEKYNERYDIQHDKLLIKKSLANDTSLLVNYTQKAIALSKNTGD